MLFNSYYFIFTFLPIVLILYLISVFFFNHLVSNIVLIAASLFFYSYANFSDLLIILLSLIGNYGLTALFLKMPNHKKNILFFGIFVNLSVLIFYKYLNFIISIVNFYPDKLVLDLQTHLPLAISFFTFQQISFLVDRYKTSELFKIEFNKYIAAVLFFPHLIAGPLVEYKKLIPQFSRKIKFSRIGTNIFLGLFIFILGLSKKMILADNLNPLTELAFGSNESLLGATSLGCVVSIIAYTFQLYFDFSGYSDMAVGLGLLFSVNLPFNFDSPYKATSIIDFWRRWHITLSNFLRNYLYIPLGGSKVGNFRHYFNLFITMIIGGVWHGAGWNFILWGAWHGSFICIQHYFRKEHCNFLNKFFRIIWVNWVLTFGCISVGWIFFRANDMRSIFLIFEKVFNFKIIHFYQHAQALIAQFGVNMTVLFVSIIIAFFMPNTILISKFYKSIFFKKIKAHVIFWTIAALAVLINICLLLMSKPVTFLYYQF